MQGGIIIPDGLSQLTEIRIGKYFGYCGRYVPSEVGQWLVENGFFTAPASTRFHGAFEGGLFEHSFCVAWELNALTRDNGLQWKNPRSPYVIGMLHDLCKIDQYTKLDAPDERGCLYAWNARRNLQIPDLEHSGFPSGKTDLAESEILTSHLAPIKGHGEKSVTLLSRLMDLTQEEAVCIRWHMGAFDEKENWSGYTEAIHNFPNVLWTHQADMIASHIKAI